MIDYNDKEEISVVRAIDELLSDESAKWSHEAATALVKWIEEYEEETGETAVFDPIDLRCNFSEWTKDELQATYRMPLKEIEENTIVLELFKGSLNRNFIVQEF